ncbi:MAG: hypothetical protein ACF8XB_23880 [Planctomycetota bacterium JB042]
MIPSLVPPALPLLLSLALDPALVEVNRGDVRLLTAVPASLHEEILAEAAFARREARALIDRLGLTRKSREDLRLRVFAHESGFEDHRRRTRDRNTDISPWSYYNPRDREVVAAWADGLPATRAQLRRQVGRQVLLQHAKNPSRWFEEGFAGVVEGLARDPFGDVMDAVNADRLEVLVRAIEREETCPLFELMDLQEVQFYGLGGAEVSPWPRTLLYAQSWGLLFFLLDSDDAEARAFLDAVVRRVESGRWDQQAFRRRLETLAPAWRAAMTDEALPRRADALRSAWASLYDGDPHAARGDAAIALRSTPRSRSARRALARAMYALGEYAEAAAEFEVLADDRTDDVDAALSVAVSWLRLAEETQGEDDGRKAIAAAERAADRAPVGRKHEALIVAADAAELSGDVKEALRFVRRALRLRGVPSDVADDLRDRERELVRRAIGRSP